MKIRGFFGYRDVDCLLSISKAGIDEEGRKVYSVVTNIRTLVRLNLIKRNAKEQFSQIADCMFELK